MSRLLIGLAVAALGVMPGPLLAQDGAPPAPQGPAPVIVSGVGANLNIAPKRLIFDRARRSGTVYIYNQGDAVGSFDISLVDRMMLPDGKLTPIDDTVTDPALRALAGQVRSARAILQVSPRRVTLAPRQGQTIRLRLNTQAAPLEAGEYRSHLTVSTIPPRESGMTAETASASASNQLSFQVNALFGLSIPIIVRVGEADARGAIENVRIEDAPLAAPGPGVRPLPVLTFDLVRLGASSLYGNVEVRVAGQRRAEPIGLAKGLGVYPELARRSVRLLLNRPLGAGEKLEITFTDDDSSPGKVLAKVAP